jgi:hypothetical protein
LFCEIFIIFFVLQTIIVGLIVVWIGALRLATEEAHDKTRLLEDQS